MTEGRIFLARIAAAFLLIVLFSGTFYGRYLERTYAAFIRYIPHVSLLFVLLAGTAGICYLKKKYRLKRADFEALVLLRAAIGAIVLGGMLVTVSESLIVSPVERIHFLKYGSLSFFLYFGQTHPSSQRKLLIAGISSAIIGTCEETLQYIVPERVFDIKDIVMNVFASFSGIGFVCVLLLLKSALVPDFGRMRIISEQPDAD